MNASMLRSLNMRRFAFFTGVLAVLTFPFAMRAASPSETCEDLRGVQIGSAVARSAVWAPMSPFQQAAGPSISFPSLCVVVLTSSAGPDSSVTIEVVLPSQDAWNGKLLATGNANFGGSISVDWLMLPAVARHYATASTDMGTFPASLLPATFDAGIGHPEMVKDWAYRSTHDMTVVAKALIEKYYGRRESRAYFIGCSTGGGQALTEAQRYPEDYDGIIAGAASGDRTHDFASYVQRFQQVQSMAPLFSKGKEALISKTLLATCAGKDGGAPGDQFLNNPAACEFKPSQLLCARGQEGDSCLTRAEVKALETMYDGTRNPRTGELIYPGWAKGTESQVILGQLERTPTPSKTATIDGLFRWVFGPQWDARTFDFDQDMDKTDSEIGPIVNAVNPDLSAFAKHGGKLIMFHGWLDPVVNPYESILYFDRINGLDQASGARKLLTTPSTFSRLFMAPGVNHCRNPGSLGPDFFGKDAMPDGPPNPQKDIVAALDLWVEKGIAPNEITAAKLGSDRKPQSERPLCSYPKVAEYKGTGDPKSASSFTCSEAPIGRIEFPASKYLK